MAPTTIEDFPQELVDEVIDRILDKETLRSLSLVSHTCLPGSQRRLFESILLGTGTSFIDTGEESFRNPVLFANLLLTLTQSPHLAPYTKTLIVLINDGWDYETEMEVLGNVLPKILPLFRFLNKLVWKQKDHKYIPPVLYRSVAETLQLPSLVSVSLKGVPVDILQHCSSSVTQLAIWDPPLNKNFADIFLAKNATTSPPPPTATSQSHAMLEALLIDDASWIVNSGQSNEAAIIRVLQSNIDVMHLQTLIISVMYCQLKSHAEVAKMLRTCPNLQQLSFAPTFSALHDDERENVSDPINLGALKALKTLHLGVQSGFWTNGSDATEPIGWIISLLEKIPTSNVIETIIISSSFGMLPMNTEYFGVDFNPYTQLDKILNKENFPRLKQVRFHVEEAPFYKDYVGADHPFKVRTDWVKNKIRAGMVRLRFAQLIRFSSSKWFLDVINVI
ncbi:hypothetical protein CVT25_009965 [Psilocybe cyanescens]|uniref:F-box domain-containing protein n=1 Tax=Psilocybe cyanescens TaxID=93625 RepID=A0A409XCV0_PSICY|nr:hypothetical protein CVT25_009965 [Psilocybe cyanescens]